MCRCDEHRSPPISFLFPLNSFFMGFRLHLAYRCGRIHGLIILTFHFAVETPLFLFVVVIVMLCNGGIIHGREEIYCFVGNAFVKKLSLIFQTRVFVLTNSTRQRPPWAVHGLARNSRLFQKAVQNNSHWFSPKLNSVALVRKRTIPTERPPLSAK
jgi:hypothetical protein